MGLGTFSLQYDKVIEPGVTTANPHSTYGLLYAEQGIVGLLGYLVAIGICWFTAIKAGTKLTKEILTIVTQNKKLTRDFYLHYGARTAANVSIFRSSILFCCYDFVLWLLLTNGLVVGECSASISNTKLQISDILTHVISRSYSISQCILGEARVFSWGNHMVLK